MGRLDAPRRPAALRYGSAAAPAATNAFERIATQDTAVEVSGQLHHAGQGRASCSKRKAQPTRLGMPKTYSHLSAEERGLIMAEHLRGSSNAAIAPMLGRSPSALSREFLRSGDDGQYNATASGAAYRDRRRACGRRCKLQDGTAMHAFVRNHL